MRTLSWNNSPPRGGRKESRVAQEDSKSHAELWLRKESPDLAVRVFRGEPVRRGPARKQMGNGDKVKMKEAACALGKAEKGRTI